MGYRVRKFLRRHKGQAIAAILIGLAFLGGLAAAIDGVRETVKRISRIQYLMKWHMKGSNWSACSDAGRRNRRRIYPFVVSSWSR